MIEPLHFKKSVDITGALSTTGLITSTNSDVQDNKLRLINLRNGLTQTSLELISRPNDGDAGASKLVVSAWGPTSGSGARSCNIYSDTNTAINFMTDYTAKNELIAMAQNLLLCLSGMNYQSRNAMIKASISLANPVLFRNIDTDAFMSI